MSRSPVIVRDAAEGDVRVLLSLWGDLLLRPGTETMGVPVEQAATDAIRRAHEGPDNRIVVAEVDGQLAGGAFFRSGLVSPMHPDRAVHLSHLQVDPRFSRLGVGRALVESALTWAELTGATSILVATAVSDREANRFLARLGLAQVVVLRGDSVAALRARMPLAPSVLARGGTRSSKTVGQVVAARRSQRRSRSRGMPADVPVGEEV